MDDLPPMVREFLAWARTEGRDRCDTYEAALYAEKVPETHHEAIAGLINCNATAALKRAEREGDLGQAVGDALLAALLFGVHLERKGLLR